MRKKLNFIGGDGIKVTIYIDYIVAITDFGAKTAITMVNGDPIFVKNTYEQVLNLIDQL